MVAKRSSSIGNTNEDEGQNETKSDCGEKFRAMLKCVERSSAIPACNHDINLFLACERAVFESALRAPPPSLPTSKVWGTPTRQEGLRSGDVEGKTTAKDADGNLVRSASIGKFGPEDTLSKQHGSSQGAPKQPFSPLPLFMSPQSLLEYARRAVEKQSQACVQLMDVMTQPAYPQRVAGFCSRIAQDAYLSSTLVANKLVSFVRTSEEPRSDNQQQ